ncbi:MAG: RsmE family RNA methyltransferase [candidate division KSB1 bacterium]|jgi:16S rRNA (uracil1498-N3)-methyltransferase|nr:RsmE family RNA methyltransferase [candidate division KSB1 bacterium]
MKHLEYFYVSPAGFDGEHVEIRGDELKHLSIVRRKKSTDIVHIVDGCGTLYTVHLEHIGRQVARGRVQKRQRYAGEPTFHLTLVQAMPKGSKFDLVIEKGTEIGVSRFIPLITRRSVVDAGHAKPTRWKKVAIAAMKQSARSMLPEIAAPVDFDAFIDKSPICDFQLIGHSANPAGSISEIIESRKERLSDISRLKSGIILIGPEGGFTDEEVRKAAELNFQPFSLGSRRLRSETAGIVSSAILMEFMENQMSS